MGPGAARRYDDPVYVAHLTLHEFRSYPSLELELEPGATAFVGPNGQGKTNIVEAIDYLSRLASHRVSSDTPLVRAGADRAVVRAAVVKDGRTATLEVELNPGRANRARVNRAQLPRARDIVGLVRTVVFSPEDLALVKGDPGERRRMLDDLLVLRTPRLVGVRADYERILKQRNALLKSGRSMGRGGSSRQESVLSTLEVWDEQLARAGSEILAARMRLVRDLRPYLGSAYEAVARGASREDARVEYRPSFPLPAPPPVVAPTASSVVEPASAASGVETTPPPVVEPASAASGVETTPPPVVEPASAASGVGPRSPRPRSPRPRSPTPHSLRRPIWRPPSRRLWSSAVATSSTAVSRWSGRTATSCC